MNGWAKRNASAIITIITVVVASIFWVATAGADVGHLKDDLARIQTKDAEQDACLTNIERSLGVIEGKLDIIVREVHSNE